MRLDDDLKYFEEPEFREILAQYEAAREKGSSIYMDAVDLTDVAEYYSMVCHDEERAAEAIDLALQLHPDAVDPQVFKARKMMIEGSVETAQKMCDLIDDQQNREVIFLRAELMIRRGQKDEALQYLLAMADEQEEDLDYFYYDSAYIFMDYDEFDIVLELAQKLEKIAPSWFKFWELKADALLTKEKHAEALPYIERMLDVDPFYVEAWNWSCEAYSSMAQYDKAIESADYALAVEPQNERALQLKAWALLQQENYEAAHALYLQLQRMSPQCEQHYYYDSFCLFDMADLPGALEKVKKAQEFYDGTSGDQQGILEHHAHILSELHDVDGALGLIDVAERMFAHHPENETDFDLLRARVYAENKRPLDAYYCLDAMLARPNVSLSWVYFNGGRIFLDEGYVEAALHLFSLFWRVNDDPAVKADVCACIAACYYDLQQDLNALAFLKEAIRLQASNLQEFFGQVLPEGTPASEYYDYLFYQVYQRWPDGTEKLPSVEDLIDKACEVPTNEASTDEMELPF